MNCPYCRAQNDADSHRCGRCGRRLVDDGKQFPVQHSALAPVIDLAPREMRQAEAPPVGRGPQIVRDVPRTPEPGSAPGAGGVQPSLFGPMEVRRQAPAKTARSSSQSVRRRPAPVGQQAFDFSTHTLPTSVTAAVCCEAPVALVAHRAVAAAVDVAIPLMGVALFVGMVRLVGHVPVEQEPMLPVYGAALVAVTFFYRLLCCFGERDTVGLQWAGLRLLSFHGHRPGRRERLRRLAGGLVSLGALTIGLLWALGDEEHLTWHDYLSNTFPTPRLDE